jgi:hypothetical protein
LMKFNNLSISECYLWVMAMSIPTGYLLAGNCLGISNNG